MTNRAHKGAGCIFAAAITNGELHIADAFLFGSVQIVTGFKAKLRAGSDGGITNGMRIGMVADPKRTTDATNLIFTEFVVFHRLKTGCDLFPAPALIAKCFPIIEILGLATGIKHAIDGAGTAHHSASRPGLGEVAIARFRFGVETANMVLIKQQFAKPFGHLYDHAVVVFTRLE